MKIKRIAILGAGGKMGIRTGDKLREHGGFTVLAIENGEAGRQRLAERGVQPTPAEVALPQADAVILAVPDRAIKDIAPSIIPQLKAGALVICLDPAAAYAGIIPVRPDLAYFVSHPCHPPIYHGETSPEALTDYFGGIAAKQSVVSALYAGPEDAYAAGEEIAGIMFGPILRLHRITVEQMAFLEPGVVESTTSSLIVACKEALDEAIKFGIPEQAARDFVLGHIQVQLAVVFGYAPFPFSDGAYKAIQIAQKQILRDDWKKPMTLPAIRDAVKQIVNV
ncbi:MAG: phosphogluconate dehydrogenase C-terminal domain-containing protein [Opitutaceae bacterium]|nr:phosphogluconate dehydrogenase C-terminal domain-containing protein [Opitutaceae bacterium]